MNIKFKWDGDPTSQLDVSNIEDNLKETLKDQYPEISSKSITVCLSNNILKSIVIGRIFDANNNVLMKLTYLPYENRTEFNPKD